MNEDRTRPDGRQQGGDATVVRAVALDLMDTVLTDPFREALRAATGLEFEELLARRDPSVFPAFERGEIDEVAYWAHYGDAGVDVDPEAFHRVRREETRWLPGMAELLDELDGHVIRVTASNYPRWIDELARQHLAGRFDRVIASCHLGARKPDTEFFERLLTAVELPAAAVLFVDDRAVNVESARNVGMPAHTFEGAPRLRRWLASHGLPVESD